ncbi:sensor histidine kinase [Pedobacter sp. CFBP9032]|uniref:sensor histidine kinase n=1 Tax=Pedobacter sp. CFBP9032 TaxID=3096539 RepID=UPI002A69A477|nr:sensor histidine kinase [Pedobacter sp. CFBP9032]MDY0903600.1 sensor histidine kinase [Pedobacter sp. CFBP9032]
MIQLTLKNFWKKYNLHCIIWGIYIIYEVFILGFTANHFRPVGQYVLVYITNVFIFYTHAYLVGKVIKDNSATLKFLKILGLILINLFAYILLTYLLVVLFGKLGFVEYEGWDFITRTFILSCIYRSLLFIGFATGYVYILKSFDDQKKVEILERQNLITQIEKQSLETDLVQSQNNFLRSQINPHFLFNTLNFIYNDTRKKAPMAADAIMNLSEMMRYALKQPEASELVPLREEVEQIEHLINLHKLRTANTINMALEVSGDLFGLRFPPLILLTLVENIFKHGNVTHSTQPAVVKIDYKQNTLNISTINMVNDGRGKHESHHVGLENVANRLKSFYKDDFVFKYYTDPLNRYVTEITVEVVNPMAKLNINR